MTGDLPPQQPMSGPPPGWTPPPGPQPGWAPPPGSTPPPGWTPPQGQPSPAGAYSWPPYPSPGFVPPKRRRSRWLTIALPIGLVLLLGGCGVLVTMFVTTIGGSIEPAQKAATTFAQDLVSRRWSDAQAMLCQQDQRVTADQIAAHYEHAGLTGFSIEGVNVSDINGKLTANAGIRFTTADGLDNTTTLPLVKEGGTWHPCP